MVPLESSKWKEILWRSFNRQLQDLENYQLSELLPANNRRKNNPNNFRKPYSSYIETARVCLPVYVVLAWWSQHRIGQFCDRSNESKTRTSPATACPIWNVSVWSCNDFWLFLVGSEEDKASPYRVIEGSGATANNGVDTDAANTAEQVRPRYVDQQKGKK